MQLNNLLVVQLMAQLKCQIEKKNINLTLMWVKLLSSWRSVTEIYSQIQKYIA